MIWRKAFQRGRNRVSLSDLVWRGRAARIRGRTGWLTRYRVWSRTGLALQRADASAGAAAHMRPVWCAGILRRERRTGPSESWDSEDSRGPGFSPCVGLGDWKRVSVLTRPIPPPCRGVIDVEDAFQIDSRDDRQIQVYSSFAARHRRHFWRPSVYTERLRLIDSRNRVSHRVR